MSPKLRFPEFEDEWPTVLISDAAQQGGLKTGPFGAQLKAEEYVDDQNGIPVVMPKDIRVGRIVLDSIARVDRAKSDKLKKHQLDEGDILFPRRGELGRIGLVSKEQKGWLCGTGCLRLRLNQDTNPSFVATTLQRSCSVQWLESNAVGQTMLNLNTAIIGDLPIGVPTLPEQRKIADLLTAVDGRLAQLSQKKALLEAYKKGVMQQLFTQALRFKDDHGKEFPDWEERVLGEVTTFINGRAYKQTELLKEGPYPVLRVGNFFTNPEWYYSDLELPEEKYCDTGDLLYAWSASFGPRIWRGGKVIYHYHIWKVMPSSKITKLFLFHLLDWDVERIKNAQGNGIAMMHVTKQAMEERPFNLPCVEEQTKIANFLTALDRKIEAVAAQIAYTQTWKKGLLQRMFV